MHRVRWIFIELSSEKSSELADSAKETAHDASVKAQELKESAGEKLEKTEKAGRIFSIFTYLIIRFLFY